MVEVECERVGVLSNPIWCEQNLDDPRKTGEGWHSLISRHRGVDLAKAFCPDEQPFPNGTRTIWVVGYNDQETAEQPEFGPDHQRHYEICPPSTLSTGEPVEIPPHGDRVELSCELAAVIGRRLVERVGPNEVIGLLEGFTIMVGMRDYGLYAELDAPTDRETMFSGYFGRWVDGFNATCPNLVPAGDVDIDDLEMRLSLDGIGQAVTRTSDYVFNFGRVISFLSNQITLLPGDVVSLGSAGERLIISPEVKLPVGSKIFASIESLGEFAVPLNDRRGPHLPLHEVV